MDSCLRPIGWCWWWRGGRRVRGSFLEEMTDDPMRHVGQSEGLNEDSFVGLTQKAGRRARGGAARGSRAPPRSFALLGNFPRPQRPRGTLTGRKPGNHVIRSDVVHPGGQRLPAGRGRDLPALAQGIPGRGDMPPQGGWVLPV